MYYIYHIPNFVWKDGSKGKIGCTKNLKNRIRQNKFKSLQPFDFWEVLETHECITTASNREIELQKEYGYPVDKSTYEQSIQKNPGKQDIAGSASATKQWKENREGQLKKCKKAGEVTKRKYSRTILQYDLDGNFIKEWIGVKATARKFNSNPSNLSVALNGNNKTFMGFMWKYKNSKHVDKKINPHTPTKRKHPNTKPVLQYDLDGNFIKEWESSSAAAKEFKIDSSGIRMVCRGILKRVGGFIWKYKEKDLDNSK